MQSKTEVKSTGRARWPQIRSPLKENGHRNLRNPEMRTHKNAMKDVPQFATNVLETCPSALDFYLFTILCKDRPFIHSFVNMPKAFTSVARLKQLF